MEIIKGINNFPNTKRIKKLVSVLLITACLTPAFSFADASVTHDTLHSYTWSDIKARVKNKFKALYASAGSKPVAAKPLMIRGVAATETGLPIYNNEEYYTQAMVDEGSDFMPGITIFDSNKCGPNNSTGEGLAATRMYAAEYTEGEAIPFIYMASDQKNPCFDTGMNLLRATAQYWNAYYVLYSKYDGSSKTTPHLKWITYPNADGQSEWTDYIHQDGLQDLPNDLGYEADYAMVVGEDNIPIIVVATQSALCGTGSGRCVVAMRYSEASNKYEKIVLRGSIKQGFLFAGLGLDADGKKNTLYVMGLDMNDCPWIFKLDPDSNQFVSIGGYADNLGDVLGKWVHPNQVGYTKNNVFLQAVFKTHEQKEPGKGRNEVFFTSAYEQNHYAGGVRRVDIYKIDLDSKDHSVQKISQVENGPNTSTGGNFKSFMLKIDGADMPVVFSVDRLNNQSKDGGINMLRYGLSTTKSGIVSRTLGYETLNFSLMNPYGQYKNLPIFVAHTLVRDSDHNQFIFKQIHTTSR